MEEEEEEEEEEQEEEQEQEEEEQEEEQEEEEEDMAGRSIHSKRICICRLELRSFSNERQQHRLPPRIPIP